MAYDAYNGLPLWERNIPGAIRVGIKSECSNLAARDDSLFVATGDECLRLDASTGETKATYSLPSSSDGKARRWGYVAVVDDLLFGSTAHKRPASDAVFASDVDSGRRVWVYRGKNIMHITLAVGDGFVFLADKAATPEQRQAALKDRTEELEHLQGTELEKARGALNAADVRLVVALDAATGVPRWEKPVDVSKCVGIGAGGGELTTIYRNRTLLLCSAPRNGHYWGQFFAGAFSQRSIIALSGEDGRPLWSGELGYRSRPLVVGDTVIAEPWAYDLRTGERKTRVNPITGEAERWQFARPGHHCGWVSASASTLFFRSWSIAWYDLTTDYGTAHFGSVRPGCAINSIPANGLVLIPEASSGCMCAFPNVCTVVLKPRQTNRAWGMFSSSSPIRPVKHLAINLGAPGERRDGHGTLWVAFPRPRKHRIVFDLELNASILSGGGYFRHNPEGILIEGTDKPWMFASRCTGLTQCVVPLIEKGRPSASYTVRLAFAELLHQRAGKRVFDIKLQDKVVLKDFDIVKEAGARNKAVVKEFEGVEVAESLKIEFVPNVADAAPEQAPTLNGIEIVRAQ